MHYLGLLIYQSIEIASAGAGAGAGAGASVIKCNINRAKSDK